MSGQPVPTKQSKKWELVMQGSDTFNIRDLFWEKVDEGIRGVCVCMCMLRFQSISAAEKYRQFSVEVCCGSC